jgi:hypothetical protein
MANELARWQFATNTAAGERSSVVVGARMPRGEDHRDSRPRIWIRTPPASWVADVFSAARE